MAYLIEAKDLTIENGTIVAPERGIHVSDSKLTLKNVVMNCVERCIGAYNNAEVLIDKNCVLTTYNPEATTEAENADVTIMVYADANRTDANTKVDIYGKIINNDNAQGGWAISGNGTKKRGINTINIEKGAEVVCKGDSAIYHPQGGTITINGTVTGPDGVYMKSGKLVVGEEAVIKGTGSSDAIYEYSGDGTKSPLGYGVVMEFTNYPGGIANLEVEGGSITSENREEGIGYFVSPKITDKTVDELKAEHVTIKE